MNIVVLALGKKIIHPNGRFFARIDPEWSETIDVAVRYCSHFSAQHNVTLVLSGGETVRNFVSEALRGFRYMEEYHGSMLPSIRIVLEEKSRTTPENIVFSQELLRKQGIEPDMLVVVGRRIQIPKVTVIVPRVWEYGSPDCVYIAVPDVEPWWKRFFETVFMTALSHIDPKGTSFVYTLLKKRRNG